MAATPPPVLPDDLVEEIFLRLPPDEPACLLRASLISKAWGRTISSPAFRRLLHEFHKTPPVLGFLHDWHDGSSHFIPTTAFSLAVPDSRTWRAIDFRHGHALFISDDQGAQELLVWEPITGTQRRVPVHSQFQFFWVTWEQVSWSAAVFCAADGCDHCDCHGGPYHLVFVFTSTDDDDEGFDIWASVFSSQTGTWDKLTLMQSEFSIDFSCHSSVLAGSSLLYFMSRDELILEYELARHSMTVLHMPLSVATSKEKEWTIMLTEDGGLGVGEYSNRNLKLWTREASDGTDAHWVLSRVINC